jgi:hypothetical protein
VLSALEHTLTLTAHSHTTGTKAKHTDEHHSHSRLAHRHVHLKHHLWKDWSAAFTFSRGYTVLVQTAHLAFDMMRSEGG